MEGRVAEFVLHVPLGIVVLQQVVNVLHATILAR